MSFNDEVGNIGQNLKSFVEGDIEIGNAKIPKIIPVVGVVGVVAFLGYKASKSKKSNPSFANGDALNPTSNADGSLGSGVSASSPEALGNSLLDSLTSDAPLDLNPFPQYNLPTLPSDAGLGFTSTLPLFNDLPITPQYDASAYALQNYNPEIPYLTSSSYTPETLQTYQNQPIKVSQKVGQSIQSGASSVVKGVSGSKPVASVGGIASGIGIGGKQNNTPNPLAGLIGVKAIGGNVTPVSNGVVRGLTSVIQPVQKSVQPIQNVVNTVSNFLNSFRGVQPTPKPVVSSVKPPQVVVNAPKVSAGVSILGGANSAYKPKTVVTPKVTSKPIVLTSGLGIGNSGSRNNHISILR